MVLTYGFFCNFKYVKIPKMVKNNTQIYLRGFYNLYIKYKLLFKV